MDLRRRFRISGCCSVLKRAPIATITSAVWRRPSASAVPMRRVSMVPRSSMPRLCRPRRTGACENESQKSHFDRFEPMPSALPTLVPRAEPPVMTKGG